MRVYKKKRWTVSSGKSCFVLGFIFLSKFSFASTLAILSLILSLGFVQLYWGFTRRRDKRWVAPNPVLSLSAHVVPCLHVTDPCLYDPCLYHIRTQHWPNIDLYPILHIQSCCPMSPCDWPMPIFYMDPMLSQYSYGPNIWTRFYKSSHVVPSPCDWPMPVWYTDPILIWTQYLDPKLQIQFCCVNDPCEWPSLYDTNPI